MSSVVTPLFALPQDLVAIHHAVHVSGIDIPDHEVEIEAVRSQGPGGSRGSTKSQRRQGVLGIEVLKRSSNIIA